MEQTLTAEKIEQYFKEVHDAYYYELGTQSQIVFKAHMDELLGHVESYAQQIRKEEQDKARKVAIEFGKFVRDNPSAISILLYGWKVTFDEFKKQGGSEQQKCVECGKPMHKKEIIIKGDEDTCDECLCPE